MDFINFETEVNSITFSSPAEGLELEYKTSSFRLPNSFWETVSSFANTAGGLIVLGVSENKEAHTYTIEGVDDIEGVRQSLFNDNNNPSCISKPVITDQDVRITAYRGKKLIQIQIHPEQYNLRPVKCRDIAYVRTDDGDRKATEDQLQYFLIEQQRNIDTELLNNFDISDLNLKTVKQYQDELVERTTFENYQTQDMQELLNDLGVCRRDRTSSERKYKLCKGGLLFFGKLNSIMDVYPRFQLDYRKYNSDKSEDWVDRVSSGDLNFPDLNIFSFYKLVLPKLQSGVSDKYLQDNNLTRGSYFADLQLAAKEALVNALMHAYYNGQTAIKIIDRPSYFEFSNPGEMRVSEESFLRGQDSVTRNDEVAMLFRKVGISEKAASGGPRILLAATRNHLLDPEVIVDYERNVTTIRVWKVDVVSYIDSEIKLDEAEKFIIDYLNEHGVFKFKDIFDATGNQFGSESTFRKKLQHLIDEDIILVEGKGRSSRYVFVRTEEQMRVDRVKMVKELEKKLL